MHLKINSPRFDFAVESAYDILIEYNINKLPFDPKKFCKQKGWRILKASQVLTDKTLYPYKLLNNHFKEYDGIVFYNSDANDYVIVINDSIKNDKRIRWTITHEIGHIVLNHLDNEITNLYRCKLTDYEYKNFEQEADCFAGIVLAPPFILTKLNITTQNKLKDICLLSKKASIARLEYINKYYNYEYFKDYYPILEEIFYNFIYKKSCIICGNKFISKNAKFCPICGHKKIIWGDGKMIYNDGYTLDENGKALKCPICGNTETRSDGEYCKICGTYLINKCSQTTGYTTLNGFIEPCGKIASNNARYCEYCGSETTFYKRNLLKNWKEAKIEIENKLLQEEVSTTNEFHKDNFDDDVPF